MSRSIKLENDVYLDSSGIITNIKDNEIYETDEFLNGKRVYGFNYVFSQALQADVDYDFPLNFANMIDIAWVDFGNSYFENSKAISNYNIYSLGSITGYQFKVAIMAKSKLQIRADDNWGNTWTFHIRIKFTKK